MINLLQNIIETELKLPRGKFTPGSRNNQLETLLVREQNKAKLGMIGEAKKVGQDGDHANVANKADMDVHGE